jgi:hypothetical protein
MSVMTRRIVGARGRYSSGPVWAVGSREGFPLVLQKPVGGEWTVIYTGAELTEGATFLAAARDPVTGAIGVRANGWANLVAARSGDGGVTWTYAEISPNVLKALGREDQVYRDQGAALPGWISSAGNRVIGGTICCSGPGLFAMPGIARTTVGASGSAFTVPSEFDYYNFDIGAYVVSGGGLSFSGGAAWRRWALGTDFFGNTIGVEEIRGVGANSGDPSLGTLDPRVRGSAPAVFSGPFEVDDFRAGGTGRRRIWLTIAGSSASEDDAPLQSKAGGLWDGQVLVMGGAGAERVLVRSASGSSWDVISTSSGNDHAAAAARGRGDWYFSGKGVTRNAGAVWRNAPLRDNVVWAGSRFYSVTGGQEISSSRDGVAWDTEALPAISGSWTLRAVVA